MKSNHPDSHCEGDTISQADNIAATQSLSDNVNKGDLDAAMQSFAVDHDPAPGQAPGRPGFKAFFTELTTAFPDAKIQAEEAIADDDSVAVAYTLTGTHRGEFQGISATGKTIKVPLVNLVPGRELAPSLAGAVTRALAADVAGTAAMTVLQTADAWWRRHVERQLSELVYPALPGPDVRPELAEKVQLSQIQKDRWGQCAPTRVGVVGSHLLTG